MYSYSMGTFQGHHSREPKGGRDPSRLCTAHVRKTGAPCPRYATTGTRVCSAHSGTANHVRNAASRRIETDRDKLLNSRPEAIDTSLACIRDEDALWADKVRAATAILDRAGMPAGLKLEVERSSDLKPAVLTLMQNPPVMHGETLDAVQVITTLPPTAPAALESLPLTLANRKASARTRKASEQATH